MSVSDDLAAACVPVSDDDRTSQAVLGSASIWNEGTTFGGAPYGDLIDTLRRLLAATAGARPDLETIREITTSFQAAAESLQRFTVAEPEQVYARRIDLAGRGQATWPMIMFDQASEQGVDGRVTFDRQFLGANGAAHGGAITFVFDEVAGCVAHLGGRSRARTAYLHAEFRALTPIDVELRITGRIVREENRKRIIELKLFREDMLCAEAEALMIALKPGQL